MNIISFKEMFLQEGAIALQKPKEMMELQGEFEYNYSKYATRAMVHTYSRLETGGGTRMTREEFEYQKNYGMAKVIKWGTYTDAAMEEARLAQEAAMEEARLAQEAAQEEARLAQEAAEEARLAQEAANAAAQNSQDGAQTSAGATPHMMSFPMTANMEEVDESTLSDAERFARELEKKQANRIQDDVLGMVAAVQAQQSEKDREAEEIAARAMAQAENRIQDNVAMLFAENAVKSE